MVFCGFVRQSHIFLQAPFQFWGKIMTNVGFLFNEIAPGRSCSLVIKTLTWTQTYSTVWKQESSSPLVWLQEGGWCWEEGAASRQKEVHWTFTPLIPAFSVSLYSHLTYNERMAVMSADRVSRGALAARNPQAQTGDLASISQTGRNVFITMLIQSIL